MELNGWGGRENQGGDEGEETMIRIHYIKKLFSFKKKMTMGRKNMRKDMISTDIEKAFEKKKNDTRRRDEVYWEGTR